MKIKRDLWMMGMTFLLVAFVLVGSIAVGKKHQQSELAARFEEAIDNGRSEQVKHLVNTTDVLSLPHIPGNTLACAVLYCDLETPQVLIDKGIDVNSRVVASATETGANATGPTALDFAVIHRRKDMVEVLLRNGANVNLKTQGRKPIDRLQDPPIIYRRAKRVGTDAQIAQLLRTAQQSFFQSRLVHH